MRNNSQTDTLEDILQSEPYKAIKEKLDAIGIKRDENAYEPFAGDPYDIFAKQAFENRKRLEKGLGHSSSFSSDTNRW